MLKLTIPATDQYNEATKTFEVLTPECYLELEHSLFSLSKWEQKWCKPFLNSEKTDEEANDYIRMMSINDDVPDEVFQNLTMDNIEAINKYISAPMTATTFGVRPEKPGAKKEIITAEVIYYWIVSHSIDFQTQYWHLNTLLALIKVCNESNKADDKPKKLTQNDLADRAAENRRRKAAMGTTG